jgi:hypothetical protein
MRVMKWIKYALIGLVVICLVAVGGIYAASELRLAKSYDSPVKAFDARPSVSRPLRPSAAL